MTNPYENEVLQPEIMDDSATATQLPATSFAMEIISGTFNSIEEYQASMLNSLSAAIKEIGETSPDALGRIESINCAQPVYITFGEVNIAIKLK